MRFRLSTLDLALLFSLVAMWGALLSIGKGLEREGRSAQQAAREALSDERQVSARAEEPKPAGNSLRRSAAVDQGKLERKAKEDPSFARRLRIAGLLFFLLLAGAFGTFLRLIVRLLKGIPIFVPVGVPPAPAWSMRTIIRLVLGLVVFSEAILLVQWFIICKFHPAWLDPTLLTLSNTLLVDALLVAAAAALFLRRSPLRVDFRLLWASFRFGLTSYLMFLPLMALILLSVAQLARLFHHDPAPQAIFTMYLDESRTPVLVWMSLLVALVGPVAEEMFFRGVLYTWLRVRMGIWVGLTLSALLFAILHANLIAFLPIMGLGILFGWVYEQTGSLAAPIAIHVLHNAGMLYLASLIKAAAA